MDHGLLPTDERTDPKFGKTSLCKHLKKMLSLRKKDKFKKRGRN